MKVKAMAAGILGADASQMDLVDPVEEEYSLDVTDLFCREPRPAANLFVLERGQSIDLRLLPVTGVDWWSWFWITSSAGNC